MSDPIRVLGRHRSINVRKVLWALDELKVPYVHEEDWGGDRLQGAAYRALNPNALVPVLVHGDQVLWESNAICRYLGAQFAPHSLWPEDVVQRAEVDKWMSWQAADLNTAFRYAFAAKVRGFPQFDQAVEIERSVVAWNRAMAILDHHLGAAGPFVTGTAFTLADIVLALSAHRWALTPMERPALPHVATWMETVRARGTGGQHLTDATP